MATQRDCLVSELWLQFREIVPYSNHKPGPKRRKRASWTPPECPEAFETVDTLPWHIWKPGHSKWPNEFDPAFSNGFPFEEDKTWLPDHVQRYDTTSIFYSTELNNFLEVPFDCTKEHVSERRHGYDEDGWNRFTFAKVTLDTVRNEHPHLWKIGHAIGETQMDESINISDSWDNLLLPGCFVNGVAQRNTLPTCELAGKLTMIFGAVAFATDSGDLIAMIRDSFRSPGTTHYVPPWRTQREKDRGLVNQRGLIVDVAFDTHKTTQKHIEEWENGYYGPILTSNQSWNKNVAVRSNWNLSTSSISMKTLA